MYDDFDTQISVEEYYMNDIYCEVCGNLWHHNQMHIMSSFKEPETDLIVCPCCYQTMLGEKL